MKNIILFILLFAQCPLLLIAQAPDTLWTRIYDGGQTDDFGSMVIQTSDGGYAVIGSKGSLGYSDVWLIRTNQSGDTLWTRIYGVGGSDRGYGILETSNYGFVIVGQAGGYLSYDVYVVRVDSVGSIQWSKTYGMSGRDAGNCLQKTFDRGYIIIGSTESSGNYDLWMLKLDVDGDTQWTRTYGGSQDDYGRFVQQTPDSGFVVVGWTESFGAGTSDLWLLRMYENGDTVWTKTYGGTGADHGYCVELSSDQGYVITGMTMSSGAGGTDVWLLKTDQNGDTLWTRTYGGTFNDLGRSLQIKSDQGIIIGGYTYSFGSGHHDFWLISTNTSGDTLWTKTVGGSDYDFCYSVAQTADHGFIASGTTRSFGSVDYNLYIVKIDAELGKQEHNINQKTGYTNKATILTGPLVLPKNKHCRVFDITGRVIALDKMKPGIYFIEINGVITKKVVKVR